MCARRGEVCGIARPVEDTGCCKCASPLCPLRSDVLSMRLMGVACVVCLMPASVPIWAGLPESYSCIHFLLS